MVMETLKTKHKYKQMSVFYFSLKDFIVSFFSLRLHPTQSRPLFFVGPDEVQAAGKVRRQRPRKDCQENYDRVATSVA